MRRALLDRMATTGRYDPTPFLARIAAPTLVLGGKHDKSTPPEHGELIAKSIPGARYVELNAAHLSNWEVAQAFTQQVQSFLLS